MGHQPQTGQSFRIKFDAPAGVHLTLFSFTAEGSLHELAYWPPLEEDAARWFPPNPKEHLELSGKAGTEVWIVCGRRDQPVTLADLRLWWGEPPPWPRLPPGSVIRLTGGGVKREQQGRGFKRGKSHPNPEGEVEHFLEMRRRDRPTWLAYCEAVAFAHEEP